MIILSVRKIVEGNYNDEVLNAATAFFFTFVEKKLLVPGQVENWILLIDLDNVNMVSLPLKKV